MSRRALDLLFVPAFSALLLALIGMCIGAPIAFSVLAVVKVAVVAATCAFHARRSGSFVASRDACGGYVRPRH
jgi:hypothetical protein